VGRSLSAVVFSHRWNGFHENPKEHWCTLARPARLDLQQTAAPRVSSKPRTLQEDFLRDEETVGHCIRQLAEWHSAGGGGGGGGGGGSGSGGGGGGGGGRRRRPWALYCNLDYPHGGYYPAEDSQWSLAVDVAAAAAAFPDGLSAPSSHRFHLAMSTARGMLTAGALSVSREQLSRFRASYLAKCAQVNG
jgi:hypothetical protein